MDYKLLKKDRRGSILVNSFLIVMLLVMMGFSFLRWAADEAHQAEYDLARTQAYYVAQYGIFKHVLPSLRTRKPGTMPEAREFFQDGNMRFNGEEIGRYYSTVLDRVSDRGHEDVFSQLYYFDLSATGEVKLNTGNARDIITEVKRSVKLRAKLRSFANYMYLTDNELTEFDEIIWFYQEDTLWGRVHSNDQIGMKNRPMFYGPVSTCADDFIRGTGYNPWFAMEPQFNVPEVKFPFVAEVLRNHAGGGGTYLDNNSGMFQTRLEASEGGWLWEQWPVGVPYNEVAVERSGSFPYGVEVGIFVEGQTFIFGDFVTGSVTVGSEGTMWIIDNIKYSDYSINGVDNPDDNVNIDSPNMLGLIGEHDIKIADSDENGSDNGASAGLGHDRAHIVITAAIIALDESFTFEHQNDLGDTYCHCPPCPNGQGGLDERGAIYLRGAVAQRRRGYVHRSNCGGTGYDKRYKYDFRFDRKPPPHVLDAVDDKGNLLFDIVWLQEDDPLDNN